MDIIDRFETVKNCEICQGQGFTLRPSKNTIPSRTPGRSIRTMQTVECICKRNERVERKYAALHPRIVPPLSEEEVQKIAVNKFQLDKGIRTSYKFFANPEKFFRIVKASFVYLSQDASARFYLGTGIEIIKDYYVGADDRKDFMDLLNDFDLVVILFDSRIHNKALKPVMVDLIQTRLRKGLATWVWSERDYAMSEEWSEDLAPLLNDTKKFVPLDLSGTVRDTNASVNSLFGNTAMGAIPDA